MREPSIRGWAVKAGREPELEAVLNAPAVPVAAFQDEGEGKGRVKGQESPREAWREPVPGCPPEYGIGRRVKVMCGIATYTVTGYDRRSREDIRLLLSVADGAGKQYEVAMRPSMLIPVVEPGDLPSYLTVLRWGGAARAIVIPPASTEAPMRPPMVYGTKVARREVVVSAPEPARAQATQAVRVSALERLKQALAK